MVVGNKNLDEALGLMKLLVDSKDLVSVDTETTGLDWFHKDRLFSIIVGDEDQQFYINGNTNPSEEPVQRGELGRIRDLFQRPIDKKQFPKAVVFHNAKFDLHMLKREGIEIDFDVVDTAVLARIYCNHLEKGQMKLEWIANWLEVGSKDKTLDEYCKKNKLYRRVTDEETGKVTKAPQYYLAPLPMVSEYAKKDVEITKRCADALIQRIAHQDSTIPSHRPPLWRVVKNESRLTKTLFRMEERGVLVDTAYCKEAKGHYEIKLNSIESEFQKLTGEMFQKSPILFKELFKDEQEKWTYTEKGNPQFGEKQLQKLSHPCAKLVVQHSECKKQIDYYNNFLFYRDAEDIIHPDFNQSGTKTGRLSCTRPNFQNLTKSDKYEKSDVGEDFPVRRALIPRPGFYFAMLDYDQMEYRMMLDMARANGLIDKVLGGLDVHEATAQVAGVTRKTAKNVNFGILYGQGLAALGTSLGVTRDEARRIRNSIFEAAPEIRDFVHTVSSNAKEFGYIFNWLGRTYKFPDQNYAYKAPNYLIQGGCADVVKMAMNRIDDLLMSYKSEMIMTIHDELVFEIHETESFLLPQIREIMQTIYQYRRLPLTCGIDFSTKSLADKEDWMSSNFYSEQEKRNIIQRESQTIVGSTSIHMG